MIIVLDARVKNSSAGLPSFTALDTITLKSSDYLCSIDAALEAKLSHPWYWATDNAVACKVVYPPDFTQGMLIDAIANHKHTFPELYI